VHINQVKDKERKIKGKMIETISPSLNPAVLSAGGQGPPVAGACQEACPLSFYILWVPVIPPQGRSTVVNQWAWGVLVDSQSSSAELTFSFMEACNLLAYMSSQRERARKLSPGFRMPATVSR